MSDGIKQDFDIIRRDIRNHVSPESARLAILAFTRLVEGRIQVRLEAAEAVCEAGNAWRDDRLEPCLHCSRDIEMLDALAAWRKAKG